MKHICKLISTKNIMLITILIISTISIVDATVPNKAIVYDNINIGHQMSLGIPNPTDDKNTYGVTYKIEGIDTFNLNDFPLDNLPSGGSSLGIDVLRERPRET